MTINRSYWILIFSLASLVTAHNYFEYYNNFINKIHFSYLILEEIFLFVFSVIYFYFFIYILKKNNLKNFLIFELFIVLIITWLSFLIINIFSELIFAEPIKYFIYKELNLFLLSKNTQQVILYLFPFIFSPLIFLLVKNYYEYLRFVGILGFFFLLLVFYNLFIFNLNIAGSDTSIKTKFNVNEKLISSNKKLLWIVFDELDPKIYKKVSNLTKNIEKFRNKSFYHENVFSPAKQSIDAMPSIMMGLQTEGKIIKNKKFYLINDKKKYHFNFSNTIFGNLKNLGINVSIVSSAIEYCSAYLKSNFYYMCKDTNLSSDIKNINPKLNKSNFRTLSKGITNQYGLNKIYFLNKIFFKSINQTKKNELNILKVPDNDDSDLIDNDDVDGCGVIKYEDIVENLSLKNSFMFAHISLPHLNFDCSDKFVENYFKNLKNFNILKKNLKEKYKTDYKYLRNIIFIDHIIKKLLQVIEKNNLNEDLMVVISSDHWLRNQNINNQVFEDISQSFLLIKIYGDEEFILNQNRNSLLALPYLFLNYFNEKISDHNDINNFFNENNFFKKVYINY